jgi:uncharacterized protein (DUF1697 family)
MPSYIALLRAVNVGGTGKLPMSELKAMCVAEGLVKAALEKRLQAYAGKPVGVVIRTAEEMAAVIAANPFPKAPRNWTVAIFLDEAPPTDVLRDIRGQHDEEVQLGKREIYVAYGAGMGRSKLKIPAAAKGTARNINTVAKLAELAAGGG